MPLILAVAAVAGAASSYFGSQASADAAEKSAQMQMEMYQQNKKIYEENRGLVTPFIDQGTSANKLYGDLTGANGPEAQAAAMKAYQSSPYLQQMIKNTDASVMAAAGKAGTGVSGNVLNDLYNQNAGLYNQDYQQNLSNLSNLSSQGLQGTGVLAGMAGALTGAGTQAAANAGQATQAAGNATGAGYMGMGNAATGAASNYLNYTMMQNYLNKGNGANAAA